MTWLSFTAILKASVLWLAPMPQFLGEKCKYVKIRKHSEDERASTATAVRSHQYKSGSSTYGVGLIKKKWLVQF